MVRGVSGERGRGGLVIGVSEVLIETLKGVFRGRGVGAPLSHPINNRLGGAIIFYFLGPVGKFLQAESVIFLSCTSTLHQEK